MADPSVGVTISRTLLGLGDLNLNDHISYITSAAFFGAGVTYRRSQVKSPYVEGAITTNRVRDVVQDQVSIDVLAPDYGTFQTNIHTLQDAFAQDEFILTLTLNGVPWAWLCEAADYKMDWSVPRIFGLYGQVQYTLLRQPLSVTGPNV
jgi:hypothetical protein